MSNRGIDKNIVALFELGKLYTTPGAQAAMMEADQDPLALIQRHVTGDWSKLDEHDQAENRLSIDRDLRIMSAYTLSTGVKVWVITEADRSSTTVLLPSEY